MAATGTLFKLHSLSHLILILILILTLIPDLHKPPQAFPEKREDVRMVRRKIRDHVDLLGQSLSNSHQLIPQARRRLKTLLCLPASSRLGYGHATGSSILDDCRSR